MPTYVYRRRDGTTFEIIQRITDDALHTCPITQQPVHRVISGGTGLIFKGSGFYQTDYGSRLNGEEKTTKKEESTSTPEPEKAATDA